MSFHSWLQTFRFALEPRRGQFHYRRRGSLRAATHRPHLEILEDRTAPANLLHSLFPASGPQQGAEFGVAVATDTNFHVAGASFADVGGFEDVGQAFVYNASTGALVTTLNDPDPASQDYFGTAVAVSGNLVVVGAYAYPNSVMHPGRAYVFNATSGALVTTLTNPTPADLDFFGLGVALSGNLAVVGAEGAAGGGKAYVFNATTGALISTLNNPTPAGDDDFGFSVAVSGNTVAVGAWQDDTGSMDSGTVYLFNATTGALVATLNNPAPAAYGSFGFSVGMSGNTVIVGARDDDTGATNAGSAYTFNATTGALVATLNNPAPASNDGFGIAVALSGNTAVVGALWDDAGAVDAGSAYVFNATTGALVATLNNPTTASQGDRFGLSVAVSGNTVVVGSYLDDTGATDSGTAYVINAATGALLVKLNNPTPANGDNFGFSVAVSGNLVVVGAINDDAGATNSGAAYVFNATTGALVATLNNPNPASSDYFGVSVAVSANIAVVGAYGDPVGAFIGKAYAFNAITGALIATLNNPAPVGGEQFGYSVAVSGNTAVVGDHGDENYIGSAYVFNATTGALVATLNNPTPTTDDFFGISVALSGNTAVVGAEQDGDVGTAYVFNATTGALLATLNNPTPESGDFFGNSVAVSGNTVVVGSDYDDTGALGAGSAYVFNATTGALIDTLNNPTPAEFDLFGHATAVSGTTVVIGAFLDDTQNTDQGAVYVYSIAAPTVQAVRVNDGSVQRSRVTSLQVTFSTQVSFATTTGAAFTLTRVSDGAAVSFTATASIVGGVTVVTLNTFTGGATQFGSLADGRYTLTALASQISSGGQPLNGGTDFTFGEAQGLFRLFGDINGDRHVDIADFGLFSSSIFNPANYVAAFDFNNDGVIDIADFGQFSIRIFTPLP